MTTTSQPHAGNRPVIAFIGNRNAGKSSLLNKLVDQAVSIVSDTLGTTTDAVLKTYELIPVGPVSFYDTAGLDDEGELGNLRIKATEKILRRSDIAIYVVGKEGFTPAITSYLDSLKAKDIPLIVVLNFADTRPLNDKTLKILAQYQGIETSAQTGLGIDKLKNRLIEILSQKKEAPSLVADLVTPKDVIILVTPIDSAAPKGKLIMPQIQTIREILDHNGIVLTVQTNELENSLASLKNPPKLVITDSQAVKAVASTLPQDIPLTTFSMLLARAKGNFEQMIAGINAIKNLPEQAHILIAEGCSHHLTCDDIGRVKIPNMLKAYTKKELNIEFVSGLDFKEDLSAYDVIIHCGGCMLNFREIKRRLKEAELQNVPITNYGMVISLTQGVLERTAAPLLK